MNIQQIAEGFTLEIGREIEDISSVMVNSPDTPTAIKVQYTDGVEMVIDITYPRND